MATIIPITLVGENLGKRHFYLNSIVNESRDDFNSIKNLKEQSPIDRLVKIDLASKSRNVEFILQNLKDDDMLFVSRALKSTWLLEAEYEQIINPKYLEDNVYPEMITTAVTKLQHWIHKNLKDEARCQQFYQYHKETHFKLAVKFLFKCSNNYIKNEFSHVAHKTSPQYFKILCEKCPEIATLFYDLVLKDDTVKNIYLDKENEYFNTLKHLLKTDADIVLNITEMFYNRNVFKKFSSEQTKFIMTKCKKRFLRKPELYTGWLLDTQSVADNLSVEEAKELVLKLVRAKYLSSLGWSSYKKVEPLIKRLKPEERAEFKQKVFVTKDIGVEQEEWSYKIPEPPVKENEHYPTVFDDYQPYPHQYEMNFEKRYLKKRGYRYLAETDIMLCCGEMKMKTLLDKLFDEYRFVSFKQTLFDLRKRIKAESSPQNREFMMLVLVSKSGGRLDAIETLLQLLDQHCNEPSNVRAAIIRSLVKRCQVWRLPEVSWNQLLKFGQGLGLDGDSAETACYEGLHAVVIRSLLLTGECIPSIQNTFLDQFSTLIDYSLNVTEKKLIGEAMPKMLLSLAIQTENVTDAVKCIEKVIDTLNAYTIKIDTYPNFLNVVKMLAEKDILNLTPILTTLFNFKVGRKQLFQYNFGIITTDDSYVNALKHDVTVLNGKTFADHCSAGCLGKTGKFLSRLSLYFDESNGLSKTFLTELKNNVYKNKSFKMLGLPLAILLKGELKSYLDTLDELGDQKSKILAATIYANAHKSRPPVHVTTFKNCSTKLIANKLIVCRAVEINKYVEEFSKYKKTARLAFILSKRNSRDAEVFVKLASLRPTVAIKVGLKEMNLQKDNVNPIFWETIKPIIENFDVSKVGRKYVIDNLGDIDEISIKMRPEYCVVIYDLFTKISSNAALPTLCHIEIVLPNVNENFVENLLTKFLETNFYVPSIHSSSNEIESFFLYVRILLKYLLICRSEAEQKLRLEKYGIPFFNKLEELKKSKLFDYYLAQVLRTLKYCKVFLDVQYVSPLPVMEKVVVWLQKMFSIIDNFKLFTQLHITMLFCKALRQCVSMVPDKFVDEKLRRTEGVQIFGNLFGKYVAREMKNLTNEYFDSIIEMYNGHLKDYLQFYNSHYVSSDFVSSMIKGILEESKGIEHLVGVFLFRDHFFCLTSEHYQELYEYMNKLEHNEIQWFVK